MKNKIRLFLWKLLGINYYHFLEGQKKTYLHKAKNVKIGFKTYHNGAFVWSWHSESSLEIGSYCSIANDVHFILDSGFHLLSPITTFPLFNHMSDDSLPIGNVSQQEFKDNIRPVKRHIKIGNDVWIGMNAIILPNVTIGDGVTIMAGAVVSGNIPDYAVVGGVPAKIVKMKHDAETISKLKNIGWWDRDPKEIEENTADFYLPVNEFIKKWQ